MTGERALDVLCLHFGSRVGIEYGFEISKINELHFIIIW